MQSPQTRESIGSPSRATCRSARVCFLSGVSSEEQTQPRRLPKPKRAQAVRLEQPTHQRVFLFVFRVREHRLSVSSNLAFGACLFSERAAASRALGASFWLSQGGGCCACARARAAVSEGSVQFCGESERHGACGREEEAHGWEQCEALVCACAGSYGKGRNGDGPR